MSKFKDAQIKAWEQIRLQQWAIAQTHDLRARVRMHFGDLKIPLDSSRLNNLEEMKHVLDMMLHFVREEIELIKEQEKQDAQTIFGSESDAGKEG